MACVNWVKGADDKWSFQTYAAGDDNCGTAICQTDSLIEQYTAWKYDSEEWIAAFKGTAASTCKAGVSTYKNMFGYKTYDDKPYDGMCTFFGAGPPLPEGIGWVICVALGCFFAALVSAMVYVANRNVAADEQTGNNSEVYSTAGRTISAGLTAADVVSKWTWAATLLQSSNVAWNYGVSGPFWYASGATIQVLLFAILAIEIKRKCPAIHTMLEIVMVRWGSTAHIVFLFFGLLTCLIVTAMLILGGAATINALTGMSTYAANFMIPVPVMLYTAFGGLKGTYYASFTHTAVIYLALLIFLWKIYAGPSDLGSVAKMHANLKCAAVRDPVNRNSNGEYLTMNSLDGLMFGIINTVGNFGTVFVDQSYWQGAIACKPSATYRGYLLGGMAWFAIPFSMATALGLAGRALDLPISAGEAGNGLVPPAVAVHLMGQGGAFLVAFQLFLAITSTANSEQLAVASLFSYDVYKRYINPNATGSQMIFVSRIAVCFWGVFSGIIATILYEMGIGLGWVYGAMGNFIGSAVVPIALAICWSNANASGAVAGAISGLVAALVAWIGQAAQMAIGNAACNGVTDAHVSACLVSNPVDEGSVSLAKCIEGTAADLKASCDANPTVTGVVNVTSMGTIDALLAGNVCAIMVSAVVCIGISLASPQNYNWEDLRTATDAFMVEADRHAKLDDDDGEDGKKAMDKAAFYTQWGALVLSIVLVVLWPLLSLPADPFSEQYFSFWVVIAFIWGHVAFVITVLLPIYEFATAKPEEKPAPKAAPEPAGFAVQQQPVPVPMQQMAPPMQQMAPAPMPTMQAPPVQAPAMADVQMGVA